MLTCLKNVIYDLIVGSRILFYLTPIYRSMFCWLWRKFMNEDSIKDDAGCSITVTKWNGKIFPPFGKHRLSTIKDIRIRKDDVFLCGYPKTGCHWVYEILRMLQNKNAEVSKYGKIWEGMIEFVPDIILDSFPSPRVLNSHMLYEDLPKGIVENKTKIVMTIRCPKDTFVSYYNHIKALRKTSHYEGTFENHFKMVLRGEIEYGDYFDFYLSWDKVMQTQKDNQIFVLEFEDLKENTVARLQDLAMFLGINITPKFAEEVAKESGFSAMKKKRPSSPFIRKGIAGDWKNWLTQTQSDEVDNKWRQKMKDVQLITSQNRYCS